MIDFKKYRWLDASKRYTGAKSDQTKRVLDALDKKQITGAKKNILAQYYFYRMTDEAFEVDADTNKAIKHWQKSNRYSRVQMQYLKEEQAQYTMTGIVMVIAGTLFIFFLNAVIRQRFLVNFSMDAVVGAIALVLCIRNGSLKYRLIRRYTSDRTYVYMDISAFLLCVLVKGVVPPNLDFSLIILFADYILSKRRFDVLLNERIQK